MIIMERFVFWGDVKIIKEQLQIWNCIQLSVKICYIDRDSYDWLEKVEVMEDYLFKEVILESFYKGG